MLVDLWADKYVDPFDILVLELVFQRYFEEAKNEEEFDNLREYETRVMINFK